MDESDIASERSIRQESPVGSSSKIRERPEEESDRKSPPRKRRDDESDRFTSRRDSEPFRRRGSDRYHDSGYRSSDAPRRRRSRSGHRYRSRSRSPGRGDRFSRRSRSPVGARRDRSRSPGGPRRGYGGRHEEQRARPRSRSPPRGKQPEKFDKKPMDKKPTGEAKKKPTKPAGGGVRLIEVIANDRLGGKVRVKCSPKDTIGDLKKLIGAQKGTKAEKIVLKKWYNIFKDHLTLEDYDIHDGMSLEMH